VLKNKKKNFINEFPAGQRVVVATPKDYESEHPLDEQYEKMHGEIVGDPGLDHSKNLRSVIYDLRINQSSIVEVECLTAETPVQIICLVLFFPFNFFFWSEWDLFVFFVLSLFLSLSLSLSLSLFLTHEN